MTWTSARSRMRSSLINSFTRFWRTSSFFAATADGSVVVELPYGSTDWLVREVLKGVGDLVVLEPDAALAEALESLGPA